MASGDTCHARPSPNFHHHRLLVIGFDFATIADLRLMSMVLIAFDRVLGTAVSDL